ncbi:mitochondrial fission process protein 1-like [Chrysoperla carnea]|uniref:mitochondrial fission process protein 1-like n=1 Tax=Chrysoperla carnea TaxID=189513 RepID=UPI001D062C3E|nr:mitochondrial fission process protein 1-like [Chrysoperla carnea]XP_044738521.1 mitochondrial fission process protein 1-like [Chrysoperla carnea]
MTKEDSIMTNKEKVQHEYDIYKDSPVRLLGYANEVGEAFRNQFGSGLWIKATYGIAVAYVIADALDKTVKTYRRKHDIGQTALVGTDTLIWQLLASVAIPGYTINRLCAVTNKLIKKRTKLPSKTRSAIVSFVGLAAIPIILKPIDHLSDKILDITLRKITDSKE